MADEKLPVEKSEDDVFEAIYNQYVSPTTEVKEETKVEEPKAEEKPAAEAGKKEPALSSPAPAPAEPAPEQKQEPFKFEEDKLYPVPGKHGVEYIPFPKLKRLLEQGRGAVKLVEDHKKKETELGGAIAIHESLVDIPAEARTALYDELGKVVDKFREEAKLGKKFDQQKPALPEKYQKYLDSRMQRDAAEAKEKDTEKSLTKLRGNVTEVIEYAKAHFGHDISEEEGARIRQEANILSERSGIGLEQIDLVGIYGRLFPAQLKAKLLNDMEAKGAVKAPATPTIAPKSAPQPRGKAKRKMAEYSQAELNDMPREEREELVMEELKTIHGR